MAAKNLLGQYKLTQREKVKGNWAAREFLASTEEVEYACGHVLIAVQGVHGARNVRLAQKGNVLMCVRCANRLIKAGVFTGATSVAGRGKVLGKKSL